MDPDEIAIPGLTDAHLHLAEGGLSLDRIDLTPTPRYDLIARSVGAEGERVEDPAELMGALRRGLARVRDGQTAVVDVAIE